MKKFLAALIALVILVGAAYFGARVQMKHEYEGRIKTLEDAVKSAEKSEEKESIFEEKTEITGATIEAGLNDIGLLCTAEYYFTHVTDYENMKSLKGITIPLTKTGFIYSYEGNVLAGIDFGKIIVDKNEAFKTVTVTLPPVEIISSSVDPDSFKLYDEKTSIFNPIKVEDVTNSYSGLITEEEHKAIEEGLFDRARENAETLIKTFLEKTYVLEEYSVSVIDA